ncbi:MAG: gfo/Idh/MocA family oxidoreductase, partial [Bacteroidota bacterium]
VIGKLKEVHNWSHRPVWPQYTQIPEDKPPLPEGFDWDLWLGPEADRPYHPYYTNMVFRGWYDFGGGAMADMGHYSLWTVFNALGLEKPTIVEPNFVHVCDIQDNLRAYKIRNDFAYPLASKVRFRYPARGDRGAVDLYWYDGGIKPSVPDSYYDQSIQWPSEGMMFVGESGIILTNGFHVRDPYVLEGDMKLAAEIKVQEPPEKPGGVERFVRGVKEGRQIQGSFREAWPITEAVNLYGVALRAGTALKYDPDNLKITNDDTANGYLDRSYRPGWDIDKI